MPGSGLERKRNFPGTAADDVTTVLEPGDELRRYLKTSNSTAAASPSERNLQNQMLLSNVSGSIKIIHDPSEHYRRRMFFVERDETLQERQQNLRGLAPRPGFMSISDW